MYRSETDEYFPGYYIIPSSSFLTLFRNDDIKCVLAMAACKTHTKIGVKSREEEENGWKFNGKWLSRMKQQSRVRPEPDTQNSPRIEWEITFYGIVVVFIDPLDIVLYSTFCIFFFVKMTAAQRHRARKRASARAPHRSSRRNGWQEKQRKFSSRIVPQSKRVWVESTAEAKKCWFFPLPLLRVLEEWMEVCVGGSWVWVEINKYFIW